jgi:hypothetical protein
MNDITCHPRFHRILLEAAQYQVWLPLIEAARKGQVYWRKRDGGHVTSNEDNASSPEKAC